MWSYEFVKQIRICCTVHKKKNSSSIEYKLHKVHILSANTVLLCLPLSIIRLCFEHRKRLNATQYFLIHNTSKYLSGSNSYLFK